MVYLASTWCTVHNAGGSWYIGRHIAVLKSHNFFNILQIKQDKLRCQRIICTKLKINTFIVFMLQEPYYKQSYAHFMQM